MPCIRLRSQMVSRMHPTQGAKQDWAKGSWSLLSQPRHALSHPAACNRIGERGSTCSARMLMSGYTTCGRFSVTQTHMRGLVQPRETTLKKRGSGEGRGDGKAKLTGLQGPRGWIMRLWKERNGVFQEGDHTGKSDEVETDPGRNRGLGGRRERISWVTEVQRRRMLATSRF